MKFVSIILDQKEIADRIYISYDHIKEGFWNVTLNWRGLHHVEVHAKKDMPDKMDVALRVIEKYAKRFDAIIMEYDDDDKPSDDTK